MTRALMNSRKRRVRQLACALCIWFAIAPGPVGARTHAIGDPDWMYNTDYLFGISRYVANSSYSAPVRPALFLFSVPLDLAFLPFAAVGGLFGGV